MLRDLWGSDSSNKLGSWNGHTWNVFKARKRRGNIELVCHSETKYLIRDWKIFIKYMSEVNATCARNMSISLKSWFFRHCFVDIKTYKVFCGYRGGQCYLVRRSVPSSQQPGNRLLLLRKTWCSYPLRCSSFPAHQIFRVFFLLAFYPPFLSNTACLTLYYDNSPCDGLDLDVTGRLWQWFQD